MDVLVLLLAILAAVVSSGAEEAPIYDPPGKPMTSDDFLPAPALVPLQAGGYPQSDLMRLDPVRLERDTIGVGDMPAARQAMMGRFFMPKWRAQGVTVRENLWPGGKIPYILAGNYEDSQKRIIKGAIQEFNSYSCVKYVPRINECAYVYIFNGGRCYSRLGRVKNGRQELSIGLGCLTTGIILHELLHCAGFWHEHMRPDRDKHVAVLRRRIIEGREDNFLKKTWNAMTDLKTPYDYASIMHYGHVAYSKDGKPTILTRKEGTMIGQHDTLSLFDQYKLNLLYGCNTVESPIINETPEHSFDNGKGPVQAGGYPQSDFIFDPERLEEDTIRIGDMPAYVQGEMVPGTQCRDHHRDCKFWARKGDCNDKWMFMKTWCPVTCNACKS